MSRPAHSAYEIDSASFNRVGNVCKRILNGLAVLANRPMERWRFERLPMRYLEDIGLTIAERDAQIR